MYRVVRVHQGALYTRVQELRHPDISSTVTLIGMQHFGEQAYYDQIATIVRNREQRGARVHYEWTRDFTAEELARLTPEQRDQLNQLRQLGRAVNAMFCRILGLKDQASALQYSPTWQNHDASMFELIQANILSDAQLRKLITIMSRVESSTLSDEEIQKLLRRVFVMIQYLEPITRNATPFARGIVGGRNRIALAAAFEEIRQAHGIELVCLWGAGHLPGLRRGFMNAGFVPTKQGWLRACSIES